MPTRLLLALAALWDLACGGLLLAVPEGRGGVGSEVPTRQVRGFGGVVIAFGLLYGALAIRPWRPLLVVSALAKTAGGANGVLGAARGARDVVTLVSLADAVWVPGFARAALGAVRR